MSGYVYAIECAGRVKLGFSEDPERRFNKVASDAPFPCHLLAYWPGSKADELDVQAKFRSARVHGEWFVATAEILEFVSAVGVKAPSRPKGTTICGVELARGEKGELASLLGIDASVSEIEQFKTEIERFIQANGLTPTGFGKKFAGDPLFVFQLREGREPRTETRSKILEAMKENMQ